MPPELKRVIKSIAEMTCANCAYADSHWQEDVEWCRLHLIDVKDNFAQITNGNFFCSEGAWRIEVVKGRVSSVSFLVAYDYLGE